VAVTAHFAPDRDALERSGADLVLLPYADAADQAVDLLIEPGVRPERPPADRDEGPPAIDPDAEIDASRA
jgi:hypothetical protein